MTTPGPSKGDTLGNDVVARHWSTKVHSWRGKYGRIWAITPTAVHHVDPDTFKSTNTWPWADVVEFVPTVSTVTDFTFTIRTGKKTEILKFVADHRTALLCDLQRYSAGETNSRRFVAVKITRASTRQECALELLTWCVNVLASDGRKVSQYLFKEITAVKPLRDDPSAVVIYAHGRGRLFAMPERAEFLRMIGTAFTKLGMAGIVSETGISTQEFRSERLNHGNDNTPRIAEFDVLKTSPKAPSTPKARKLVITETSFTERDAMTYAVVSSRALTSIFNLVRHWDEPQRLTIEYRDGSSRTYVTSLRDACLGSLLDAARNVGNDGVGVSAEATRNGDRCLPWNVDEDGVAEAAYLVNMGRNTRSQLGAAAMTGPYNQFLVRACAEFNVNVSPIGLSYGAKKGSVTAVLPDIVSCVAQTLSMEDMPSSILVTLLNAITRIIASSAGYRQFMTLTDAPVALSLALRHPDDGVCYAGFELLRRMLHNTRRGDQDEDSEAAAKKLLLNTDMRVTMIQALDTHATGGGSGVAAGNEGTLAVMAITACLDSVLVSHQDTTPPDIGDHLMQLVASRYSALLSLFRCRCSGVVESCAMLMRTIVDMADLGTCRAMQAAALSSGVWLRHFFNSSFAHSQDQRFVSRYLVELWSTGNPTAREVLRHMLPTGLLLYLDMPKLTGTEHAHLESVESTTVVNDKAGNNQAAANASKSGLAQRLRMRLEMAERASHNKVKRRLAALDENTAGAKRGYFGNKVDPAAQINMAAVATAAVNAQKEMTRAKINEEGKEENYAVLFFQMMQDHMLPDLIWNQQTRGELRSALEAELREIEREIELGGSTTAMPTTKVTNAASNASNTGTSTPNPGTATNSTANSGTNTPNPTDGSRSRASSTGTAASTTGTPATPSTSNTNVGSVAQNTTITGGVDLALRVAWNYSEFEVDYPCLVQELRVGDYYLRLLLEAGDASVAALREPARFFDALYRRVLRENAPNLKCMCLRGMTRVYERHHKVIGPFDDTDYIVYLLSTATHSEVRDRLLLLLLALSVNTINSEKMINPDCLELLVDLLTTAHTQENEQRAMPALKAGAALLLTDATPGTVKQEDNPETAAATNPKESMKLWHYRAKKVDLQPGEKPEKGPYSLQDMQRLGDMKKIFGDSLVWAQGMREWVRLDALRALLWYTCSEGVAALTPVQRGEVCCELLRRLVVLRPAVDAEGAPVRPVPKAKRVLCGPRTLPHICQALLAGSPKLTDLVAQLLIELVRHNPKAMIKLYNTGVFFFALGYNGSNWNNLSNFLYQTHLSQSFLADAASIGSETSVGRRSILGTLIPESLICVLANKGATGFAETFLSNVDNPEVIWKYSMRSHLLDMIAQHLGDLPARLAANPCTLYDYCPIPPVKYEELDAELWCSNYYLNNLTDESRFPDWNIADPVGLLRAVLDAWRLEVTKTGEKGVSMDEAYGIIGLPVGADEKEIRKAYRKLAMKFHPDKNPAGRETFEKIQKAYETITNTRATQAGGAAGGPDPVSIILMIRTQCILFARHAKILRMYKYAGYPLLLEAIAAVKSEDKIAGDRANHLEACTKLVYLTCLATPKNAEELVREGGTEALMYLLSRMGPLCCNVIPALPADSIEMRILDNIMHTLSGLATLKEARERMVNNSQFASLIVSCLTVPHAARIMQHALESISRLAVTQAIQESLVNAGAVYRLLPLLFRFDATLEAQQQQASNGQNTPTPTANNGNTHTDNEQKAANQQAKLAVRALGRLGGYLEGDLATPYNARVRRALAALLTPPLAKRLSRPSTEPILKTLNSHEEGAIVVWNAGMRKELLTFVQQAIDHLQRTGTADMGPAASFIFTYLREELRISGIYIKFYVQDSAIQLDDPHATVVALLRHIAFSRVGGSVEVPEALIQEGLRIADEEGPPYAYDKIPTELAKRHIRLALRALHLVIVNCAGSEASVAKDGAQYLPPMFGLLEREDVISSSAEADDNDLVHAAATTTNKGAAGTGNSAGNGGARSTPAPPNASLRELILTAIAAFAPNEACATVLANRHLVPTLVRLLPRDSGAFGPILRTLFSHTVVVAEMARIGAIIDLVMVFAGGPVSGPPPKLGAKASASSASTMPKPARAAAAALLSAMASDNMHGPALLMNLTQLMPEALAIAVKESLSGATSAGTGSSGIMVGGGIGASGAGGSGSGTLGDVVTIFDSDQETPELIWNPVCRHELRAALTELHNGLNGLRRRAGQAGSPGGADGCGWTIPATFRVRYSSAEGELRVGGVYIRLFLKEPTFPLRDPKAFLEALLRRFCQEGEHICGMTSEDAEKIRAAQHAATEAAKAEEQAGGVGMRTRADVSAENALVIRGEDVITQLTHAIVCLLRVRQVLADQAAGLGYIQKLVALLGASTGKPARYNLGVQSARVIQVLAPSRICIGAMAKCNTIAVMLRIVSATPLPRDAAFFLETMKQLLETDTNDTHVLIEAALRGDAINFLVGILEREKLDHLVDPSAAKVHSVAILKLLENDALHGPAAQAQLQASHGNSWDKYRHQKHDLFLSRNDTRDYFLTDASSSQPTFMLKNTAEWGSENSSSSSSNGSSNVGSTWDASPSASMTTPPLVPSYSTSSNNNTVPPSSNFYDSYDTYGSSTTSSSSTSSTTYTAPSVPSNPFGGSSAPSNPFGNTAAVPSNPFGSSTSTTSSSTSSTYDPFASPAPAPSNAAVFYAAPVPAPAPPSSNDPFADLLG